MEKGRRPAEADVIGHMRPSIKDVRTRVCGGDDRPNSDRCGRGEGGDSGHADVCKIALILPLIPSTNTVLFTFGL